MRAQFGLDRPLLVQYAFWVWNLVRFDFGISLDLRIPITTVTGERLPLTVVLAVFTVTFTWLLAIPIGIYSAVRQNSIGDYTFTFIGFFGLAVPDFLLALVLMYFAFQLFDANIGGLFSPRYVEAAWDMGRVVDLFSHLWLPAFVLGTSGTAALFRIMRANLLDELHKPYVITARAKGLSEWRLNPEIPGARSVEPVYQHHRVRTALPNLGQHHRIGGAEPADSGAAAAQGAAAARDVLGGNDNHADRRYAGHRHAYLRHPADGKRPAHQVRVPLGQPSLCLMRDDNLPLRWVATPASLVDKLSSLSHFLIVFS